MQNVGMPVAGRWEPSLTHRFMPRCASCHAPHPMARKPPVESNVCPDCGHPSTPAAEVVSAPVSGGLWLWLANRFNAIARWLLKTSERL
jgi:hypothetical protein